MLRTLQLYIFREMGKTFALTLLGLTAVLSMGGGVLNMIRLDEVTLQELLKLMTLVLPVAATLTLPVATMYSAAATYGRLAADNELTACRSSGINILSLLWPTVLLSLVSAVVTFGCLNFLIPNLVRNLDEIVAADLETIIRQRLNNPGQALPGLGRYRLYTEAFDIQTEGKNSHITLTGVVFMEMGDDEVVRVGTASPVDFLIDRSAGRPKLSGMMNNVRYYDRKNDDFMEVHQFELPTAEIPFALPQRIKFLNLPDLYFFRKKPTEWVDVREAFESFRLNVGRAMTYAHIVNGLALGEAVKLDLPGGKYELRCGEGSKPGAVQVQPDGSLLVPGPVVVERQDRESRTFTAERATIEIAPADSLAACQVLIDLYDKVQAPDFGQLPQAVRPRDSFRLKPAEVPAEVVSAVEKLDDNALLSPQLPVSGDVRIQAKRLELTEEIDGTVRKITGVLHQRFSFTASVFALGLLAAALGILFSQSQLLVSVGISMIPGALVLVTILMGKQLTEKAGTGLIGLGIMWGGLALVAALDGWLLLRKVRR